MSVRHVIAMLGRFEIWQEALDAQVNARAMALPATAKSQSLLAYLLLHRESPQPREALAEMFWPGRPPQRARRSLSTALWRIRRCFDPLQPVQGDHHQVQLCLPGDVIIDVEQFEREAHRVTEIEAMQRAAAVYQGPLLPGFYDEWVIKERRRLQQLHQNLLVQLMTAYEGRGEMQMALKIAHQVLDGDACNEIAHRTAMRAYARLGQNAAALAQYKACQEALARELNAMPSPETTAQYRALLQGDVPLAPRLTPPPSPPAIRPPPLVGRDQEQAWLLAHWQKARQGHGGLLFIAGEAGVGKTRLLAELAQQVRQTGQHVLAVQCFEYERGDPHAPLADVAREAIAVGGDALLHSLPAWQLAHLARLLPELQERLPPGAAYLMGAELQQRQLLRSLIQLTRLLGRTSPWLLLMDDLQWAHPSTLAWLPALAQVLKRVPALVVGAYRIEEVAPSDLLAKIAAQLQVQGLAQTLMLQRLTLQALGQWLHGLDAEVIARIHRHTEGNPFFLLETVRTLEEEGRLQRTPEGYRLNDGQLALPLPETVRQIILMRLDGLSALARQGLAAAAVIGRVFDLDVWIQVWGKEEDAALNALEELRRKRWVKEATSAFAGDAAFEHHLVQETVYHHIPRGQRQLWHKKTARTLERLHKGRPGVSAEIAHHYLRANEPALARAWLLQAGDQAVAVAATPEALRFYQRALAAYPADEAHRFQRAVLLRKIGDVYFQRGDYGAAETHLRQALTLLAHPLPPDRFSRHWALGMALLRQIGRWLAPLPFSLRGLEPTPALKEEVAVYTALGWMYSLQSRYEEYLLVSLRALNRSEDAGYDRGVAVAATALGIAADFMARYGLAAHFHRQAQNVVKDVEAPADAAFVAFGLAYHAYLTGDESLQLSQAALAAARYRQAGDVHRWALAQVLRAYVLAYRGDLDEVNSIGRELTAAGEEMEDAAARCAGEGLLGTVARWRGLWEEAVAHYQRAINLAEEIPDNMSLVEHLAGLARCQLRLGRWQEAWESLEKAQETAIAHEVKGDVLGHYAVAALEIPLWAAEHPSVARAEWLARAERAVAEARKQANIFRPAQPEVWRLCGRYAWLRGRPDAARRWWEKSMTRADEMAHRLDWAATALEMGLRLDAPSLRAQGRARLQEAGAAGEIAFLEGERAHG